MKVLTLFILISALFFCSCGVILDTWRLVGVWELKEVEYYVYNPAIDAIRTYKGVNDETSDTDKAILGEFFGFAKDTYYIEFDKDNRVRVSRTDNTPDVIVDIKKGKWNIDSFDNSLTIKITGDEKHRNFWYRGFTLKNVWPMVDYQTLELYIKEGGEIGPLYIRLGDKSTRILGMKGIFKK